MRDSRYLYYKRSGKAVHIYVSYDFGQYAVYIDDKYYGCGDTRAEADEIVRDYADEHGLSATKPKPAKRKTSRSVAGKRVRKVL